MAGFPIIYLNENIEYPVKKLLEAAGFSVVHTLDADNGGKNDEHQLTFAARKKWVMVTHNRKDFRQIHKRWVASKKVHSGIIVVGSVGKPEIVAQRIINFFHSKWAALSTPFCEAPSDL